MLRAVTLDAIVGRPEDLRSEGLTEELENPAAGLPEVGSRLTAECGYPTLVEVSKMHGGLPDKSALDGTAI